MEAVKKINLLDATKNYVYHDELGWVSGRLDVSIIGKVQHNGVVKEGKWTQTKLYIKNAQGSYEPLGNMQLTNKQLWNFDFGESFHYFDYCYFQIEDPIVSFSWHTKEITADAQIEVYEGEKRDVRLEDWQIKENLRVQHSHNNIKGTFIVTKLFEQPNRENNLCLIERLVQNEAAKETPITIPCNQHNLYSVPYETYEEAPDETSVFNQPLNEGFLAPFVEKLTESTDANLYWLPIADASSYRVSLYKKRNAERLKHKIYLLEQFEIDRNQHWITLHNLIGGGYIAVLEAENREGSVIARTRGISIHTKELEWF